MFDKAAQTTFFSVINRQLTYNLKHTISKICII